MRNFVIVKMRPAAADALAAVEDRPPGGEQDPESDHGGERERRHEEQGREDDVERAQLEVDPPPVGRLLSETRVTLGKALLALHGHGHRVVIVPDGGARHVGIGRAIAASAEPCRASPHSFSVWRSSPGSSPSTGCAGWTPGRAPISAASAGSSASG